MSKKRNKNRINEKFRSNAVDTASDEVKDSVNEEAAATVEGVAADEEADVPAEAAEDVNEVTEETAEEEAGEAAEEAASAPEDDADAEEAASAEDPESENEDKAQESGSDEADDKADDKARDSARASAKEELAKAQKNALKSHKERTEENEKAKENDARREARHKRRIRNQVISYVAVFLFLAIVLGGGFFIFKYISGRFAKPVEEQPAPEEVIAQTEEQIEAIIGEEEEIVPPEIEDDQIIEDTEVPEEPEVDPLEEYIDGIINQMTLEDKVAGIIMTSPEALTGVNLATLAGDGTKAALEKYKVGGLVYAPENVTSHDQFRDMIAGTLEMVQTPTFIAFPDGGGADSILAKDNFYDAVSNPADTAATGEVTNAFNNGKTIAEALKEIGINVDLAPVADITLEDGNVIGKYSYGSDPYMVSEYVKSMISGLEEGGVTSCIKYFPGLGSVTTDPATGRATTDRTEVEFRSGEFPVYIAAIEGGVNMIMISNAVVTAFDDSCPASLSGKIVTDILRNEFGYKGIIISGNLSDAAVKDYYGAGEAAVMALKAGCDMVQNPDDFEEAYNAIIDAVNQGVISEERINDCLRRIYRIKYAGSV